MTTLWALTLPSHLSFGKSHPKLYCKTKTITTEKVKLRAENYERNFNRNFNFYLTENYERNYSIASYLIGLLAQTEKDGPSHLPDEETLGSFTPVIVG